MKRQKQIEKNENSSKKQRNARNTEGQDTKSWRSTKNVEESHEKFCMEIETDQGPFFFLTVTVYKLLSIHTVEHEVKLKLMRSIHAHMHHVFEVILDDKCEELRSCTETVNEDPEIVVQSSITKNNYFQIKLLFENLEFIQASVFKDVRKYVPVGQIKELVCDSTKCVEQALEVATDLMVFHKMLDLPTLDAFSPSDLQHAEGGGGPDVLSGVVLGSPGVPAPPSACSSSTPCQGAQRCNETPPTVQRCRRRTEGVDASEDDDLKKMYQAMKGEFKSFKGNVNQMMKDFYKATKQNAQHQLEELKTEVLVLSKKIEVSSSVEKDMVVFMEDMEKTISRFERDVEGCAKVFAELGKKKEELGVVQKKLDESVNQNKRHLENISKLITKDRENFEKIKELQNAMAKLQKAPTICTICCEKESTVVLVPCGHRVCCQECRYELTTCSYCSSEYNARLMLKN